MSGASDRLYADVELLLGTAAVQAITTLSRAEVEGPVRFPETFDPTRLSEPMIKSVTLWARAAELHNGGDEDVREAVDQLEIVCELLDLLHEARSTNATDLVARAIRASIPLGAGRWNNRRGRPRGSGFTESDAAFVDEMRQRRAGGEKASAVARELAPRMPGGGTVESKADRLLRRARQEK